jgi:hypothetical protein
MSTMHDDELPVLPDKYDLPMWVRYAVNTTSRNAYYEVRIDLLDDGRYIMTKRYGPLPDNLDNGTARTQPYVNMSQAIAAANEAMNAKLRGDYYEDERPGF